MALDSIRIRKERKRARLGLLVVIALQDTKRPPLPSVFASGTDGNKGVVATWSLRWGQESLPSSTRNVQEFIRHPWVRGGDESGTGARRGSVVISASSAVAGAAAGGGVPAAPSPPPPPPPPPPAAPPGGRAASSSGASRGPSRSAPSCTRRCRTACPLCAPGR